MGVKVEAGFRFGCCAWNGTVLSVVNGDRKCQEGEKTSQMHDPQQMSIKGRFGGEHKTAGGSRTDQACAGRVHMPLCGLECSVLAFPCL
jgi:hypothetical protein